MNLVSSHRVVLTALALVVALAPSGCIAEGDDDFVDEREEDISETSQPILGGTNVAAMYPEAATLEGMGGNVPVGFVSACSATLIAPKVVLTAGHCVDGPTSWQVTVGSQTRLTSRAATYDWNNETYVNPAHHDIGLLFLDSPITLASYPTIATGPISSNAQLMRVGRVHDGVTNTLWGAVTTNPVDLGAAYGYPYNYITSKVVEQGDSGGPDFLYGTHTIVSVNSFITLSIEGLARVDQINQWITRPIDDSTVFVRMAYLDVLKREPDTSGASFWVNALNSCNGAAACLASTRVAVARALLESPENVQQDPDLNPASPTYKSAFVTHCYTNFLRRQPDAAGYAFWLNALNSTGDYSSVVKGFITSSEYRQRFGMQ